MGKKEKIIYLDDLRLASAWRLLRIAKLEKVIVLEAISNRKKWLKKLFQIKGVVLSEANFIAGHLYGENGESIPFTASKLAGQLALKSAKNRVHSNQKLRELNQKYGNNTIQLYIAKQLYLQINYWTLRGMIIKALNSSNSNKIEFWIKKPDLFKIDIIQNEIKGIHFLCYPTRITGFLKLFRLFLVSIARDLKLTFSKKSKIKPFIPPIKQKPSVLMLQEDTVRANHSLRGQPHWIDYNNPSDTYNTYVLAFYYKSSPKVYDDDVLLEANVNILSPGVFREAIKIHGKNKILVKIGKERNQVFSSIFSTNKFADKYFLIQVASLLKQTKKMGALTLMLNTKVFLVSETQSTMADAIQLIASQLELKTVAYQYSNLGNISPLMMTTADKLLIFSDIYRKVYESNGIAPEKFIPTGYVYHGIDSYVKNKAIRTRAQLKQKGVKFIVCYFDENVQHNRWGFILKEDHLRELHALALAIIEDSSLGVVVKSQFMFNTPSQLYPYDTLIQKAKSTGRYIELKEGIHRNDIYPTEAALVADLCISHKFGATAGLEAAVTGVRTILLDSHGTKTNWDNLYAQANIEYKTMDQLFEALEGYRAEKTNKDLGDWSKIIHHFDPYRDGKASVRLNNLITNLCN